MDALTEQIHSPCQGIGSAVGSVSTIFIISRLFRVLIYTCSRDRAQLPGSCAAAGAVYEQLPPRGNQPEQRGTAEIVDFPLIHGV